MILNKLLNILLFFSFLLLLTCEEPAGLRELPPKIQTITAARTLLKGGEEVAISCTASDPDDNSKNLDYQWSADAGVVSGAGESVTWRAPGESGWYKVYCRVSDVSGNFARDSVLLRVHNPLGKILALHTEPARVQARKTATIEARLDTALTEDFSFKWQSSAGYLQNSGATVIFVAPDTARICTVYCRLFSPSGINDSAFTTIEVFRNTKPKIVSLQVENDQILHNRQTLLECNVYDPDGDPLYFDWRVPYGNIENYGSRAIYTAPEINGHFEIKCVVSDPYGAKDSSKVFVHVIDNNPPEILSLTANPENLNPGQISILHCMAEDPDEGTLKYIWEADDGSLSGSGSTVLWTAPPEKGDYAITCKVRDEMGAEDESNIIVSVQVLPPDTVVVVNETFQQQGAWELRTDIIPPGSNSIALAEISNGLLHLFAERDPDCVFALGRKDIIADITSQKIIMDVLIDQYEIQPAVFEGSGLSMTLAYKPFELTITPNAFEQSFADPVLLHFEYVQGVPLLYLNGEQVGDENYNLEISPDVPSRFEIVVNSCSEKPDFVSLDLDRITVKVLIDN